MKFQGLFSLVASTGLLFFNLSNALPQSTQQTSSSSNNLGVQPQAQASIEITKSFDASFSLVSNYANNIERDCEKGSISSVTSSLESIQTNFFQLGQQFQTGLVLPRPSVDVFAQQYVKLLLKFQILIKTIYKFPVIARSCRPFLLKYTLHFLKIHRYFKSCGINIFTFLQQSVGFEIDLWGHFGFSFEVGGSIGQ